MFLTSENDKKIDYPKFEFQFILEDNQINKRTTRV